MNLQENIQRIKSMMGLNEIANPYKVEWEYPTKEYFTQELSELLGNPGRFTEQEFFNKLTSNDKINNNSININNSNNSRALKQSQSDGQMKKFNKIQITFNGPI